MSYYHITNPSNLDKPQDDKSSNKSSFDSMFSYFTIPMPKTEQIHKPSRPVPHQIREGEKYFLLTPDLLMLKQSEAAAKLEIHPSTFSKKWRQSLPDRKWPYRKHCKLERQIAKIQEQKGGPADDPQLHDLQALRDKNLEAAVIVISDADTQQTPTATTTKQTNSKPTNTNTNTNTNNATPSTHTHVHNSTDTTTTTTASSPSTSATSAASTANNDNSKVRDPSLSIFYPPNNNNNSATTTSPPRPLPAGVSNPAAATTPISPDVASTAAPPSPSPSSSDSPSLKTMPYNPNNNAANNDITADTSGGGGRIVS